MDKIRLKKEIIKLPNADKGEWCESYDEKIHGLDIIPHPARVCFCGKVGVGKTLIMLNSLLRTQCSAKPYFNVYILAPHITREWDSIDPTAVFTQMPDPYTLIPEDNKKTLLIIDDYDFTKLGKDEMMRFSLLLRFCSSHHSITVYLSYQDMFSIPPLWRKMMSHFFIWKTNNSDELSIISKRVGLNKSALKVLFKKYCPDKHDFLVIDMIRDDVRKNLYDIIPKEEYEDL